jgi:nitroreductase
MDVKDAIQKRRSIRSYQDKEVSDDIIKELIDAARRAPTGNNAQPQKYLAVKDSETKKLLRDEKVFFQEFVSDAPVILVCCSDPDAFVEKKGKDPYNEVRAIRDVSIASAFLILRATELGLGGCFVGWIDDEKLKKVLNLPERFVVPYVIPIGYPSGEPKPFERKDLDEFFYKNL